MFKQTAIVAALSLIAISAHAATDRAVKESVELKDGSIVHVFKDGSMGMESALGREFHMSEGQVMQTRDGRTITMQGNEVARVAHLIQSRYLP
ncbi:MAG TPA: CopK family periplasmic copper-binding protein [Rhodocyclaceae bacterium]|nr:CopK family periplasmic copper-binding protein [Rhodocyclaceae bacterium]